MKKALIISLYGNNNYGNKLQNYALQHFLFEHKVDSEILAYTIKRKVEVQSNLIINKIISKIKLKINMKLIGKKWLIKRKENFDKFNQHIIYTENVITSVEQLKNKIDAYDKIIVGSDQIWGLGISQIPEISFSTLTDKSKNISFSASFGIDTIPKEYIERYKNGLSNFSFISVRENEGAKLVRNIINKDVDVIVDPTMLVKDTEWLKLAKKPDFIEEKKEYILTYFVEMCSKKRKQEINKFAEKHNLKIIALNDFNNKNAYSIGPKEFLYLINNSKMIFTDSFHCCVFSIIFEKDFYAMKREDTNGKTNSRIKTLLDKFNISDRNINDIPSDFIKCKYNNKNEILEKEIEKAEKYLCEAIGE